MDVKLALTEEQSLSVYENRALSRTFGLETMRVIVEVT